MRLQIIIDVSKLHLIITDITRYRVKCQHERETSTKIERTYCGNGTGNDGISRINGYRLTELYKTVHELERQQRWSQPDNRTVDRLKKLRDCIVLHFDDGELRTLCFDLGINFDDLEGDALSDKARELVLYLNRIGRCDELVKYCREKRPNAKLMI